MRINFMVNDVAYMDYKTQQVHWGWEPTDKRIGGTEESVREWASTLLKKGHDVIVYRNPRDETKDMNIYYEGVPYMNSKGTYFPADVCINVKSSHIKPKEGEPMLYLTNETDADKADLSAYDGVIWPSNWAKENIPVNNQKVFILPHGFDPERIHPEEKTPLQCLYSSSPDRGLTSLEQIWPSVVDRYPDAKLYVSYDGKISTPNTTYGEFSEDELDKLYRTSDLWLHPCSGGELFGMSGIKAQASGAIPVYFPTMALSETIKVGVPCIDERDMYDKICELMGDTYQRDKIRRKLARTHFVNWGESTDQLLGIIKSVL